MLISNIPSVATYEYTGINTLPIPFSFYGLTTILVGYRPSSDPTDLSPYVALVPGTDYKVTGNKGSENDGDQAFKNGSVNITEAGAAKLTTGFTLVITRSTPIEQQFAYNELDNFPAKSHENGLSRLAVIAQELNDNLKRALLVPPGSAGSGEEVMEEVMEEIFAARDAAEAAAVLAEISRTASEMAQSVAKKAARNALDSWNKIRIIYATAETVSWLEEAAASLNNETGELHFKIPAGEPGPPGEVPALDIIDCGHAYQTQVLVIDCGQAVQNT